ncbi:hypothetical protein J2Z22_001483 [Paenibacillus forsythiae]|uniref:Uncharacterized protein n=1 Tax=Paenibacillus forsythiae TaxID=365616 RepID=A0ABU3H570_9BACL|nr:hypothetical protein [Paenibacillus forsythiae]MDT3425963.1 hypothetical protein [Paenibacillus forsythiae]
MKWEEMRRLFPHQYVLFSVLQYHQEGTRRYIDEVEPIRVVAEEDARTEFNQAGPGKLVYHTSSKVCIIRIRRRKLSRVRRKKTK